MMQRQFDQEFDDPVLKVAVRRCWSWDCASAELRNKITRMLRESQDAATGRQRSFGSFGKLSWVIWPVAVSASVVLAIGLFHRVEIHSRAVAIAPVLPPVSPPVFPISLENDLISRHDSCSKMKDHQHVAAPKNDDSAIATALRSTLNRPVLVFRPEDPGWKFRGASVCPVGSTPAGHLVFVKGSNALSIFSLPKSLFPSASEGSEFSADVNQHPIVAFVKDGALFCLVASGQGSSITTDDLKKMESQMQSAVARNTDPPQPRVLLTELLQPINQ